ncbi:MULTISPECIES: potassium channel family protein [Rhodopseudomonas]|uniref:Ion transporter n=1 Tax=Rhodopseudomonas palustris TaxID=1076 RepID=A0A0D7ETP9_RHOPL|nr:MULTISPECIES: potassium channel family protein [Rhodopseudomonas]KIZ44036.1 ion transporter [Rhodopseudomonas palustris]MDF3809314.1 ion channel [Rhodopseudomonas sp. BAL398]WOK19005.1 ion channel [Rhodopseudomonas sp. BAL398]
MTLQNLTATIRELYEGASSRGVVFRYALLGFDIVTVLFIVGTSFLPSHDTVEALDLVFGALILIDFAARMLISRQRWREFTKLATWTDVVAIISFLAPLAGEGGGFLRILRTLRALRDYQMLVRLRSDSQFFRRNEEVIIAVTNLAVFIFVMTAIVYETQKFRNGQIGNYADALYFTVTALTTTGFGDITLPGTTGRLISVVIMIFGVTLFFNLARALLSPSKVRFPCPVCGLQRHDSDAVHCKACGTLINIPDEGLD